MTCTLLLHADPVYIILQFTCCSVTHRSCVFRFEMQYQEFIGVTVNTLVFVWAQRAVSAGGYKLQPVLCIGVFCIFDVIIKSLISSFAKKKKISRLFFLSPYFLSSLNYHLLTA